jgi:hypothetical protein
MSRIPKLAVRVIQDTKKKGRKEREKKRRKKGTHTIKGGSIKLRN